MSRDIGAPGRPLLAVIWGAQSLSVLLSGATTISLSLWVYSTTDSALSLATILAVRLAVSIYLSPIAGSLADRRNRKTLIVLSNLALAATSGVMLALTGVGDGKYSIALVCVVLAMSGVLDSMLLASLSASVRDIRREADLTAASAIISVLDSAPLVAAPLLGALLYEAVGIGPVLISDGISFVVAAAAVAGLRWPSTPKGPDHRAPRRSLSPFRGATSGIQLIWSNPDYRWLQLGNAASNLANGLAGAGVTVFLLSGMHGEPALLGLYNAAAAVGLVVGSTIVGFFGARLKRSWAIGAGMSLAAVGGRIVLGLSSGGPLAIVTGFARSIGVQLTNVPLTAIWLEATPREHQGTVFGGRRLIGQGSYPLAVLVGGLVVNGFAGPNRHDALGSWLTCLGVAEVALALVLVLSGVLRRVAQREPPALMARGAMDSEHAHRAP